MSNTSYHVCVSSLHTYIMNIRALTENKAVEETCDDILNCIESLPHIPLCADDLRLLSTVRSIMELTKQELRSEFKDEIRNVRNEITNVAMRGETL